MLRSEETVRRGELCPWTAPHAPNSAGNRWALPDLEIQADPTGQPIDGGEVETTVRGSYGSDEVPTEEDTGCDTSVGHTTPSGIVIPCGTVAPVEGVDLGLRLATRVDLTGSSSGGPRIELFWRGLVSIDETTRAETLFPNTEACVLRDGASTQSIVFERVDDLDGDGVVDTPLPLTCDFGGAP